jgi:hypothetical protein
MRCHAIGSLFCVLASLNGATRAGTEVPWLRVLAAPDAIYTPGRVRLTFELTEATRLAGPYRLKVTIYVAQSLVRDLTMILTKATAASCDVSFPRVPAITQARYRAELSLENQFLEAQEGPLSLWPPLERQAPVRGEGNVWIVDTSGVLQAVLPGFGVTGVDAAFQAVRDFGRPQIIFVGERLDSAGMKVLFERIAAIRERVIVVLLRQRQLPDELGVIVRGKPDVGRPVVCASDSPLLAGLAMRDVTRLLCDAHAVEIEGGPDRAIDSHVSIPGAEPEKVLSYLGLIKDAHRTFLCCQLPTSARDDPRQMTLLHNIVQYACRRIDPVDPPDSVPVERAKP